MICWGWCGDSTDRSAQGVVGDSSRLTMNRTIQQGGEYNTSIDVDISALLQMLAVPYSFVESAESAVCLGQSVVYFPGDLDIWCDSTPPVSELVNCFQLSFTDGYVGKVVLRVQAGGKLQSSSSWPWVQRAGQPLQSRKFGTTGLFLCGRWGQNYQQRRGYRTAAHVFLYGHAVSWG